jgi:hypothetical protein
VHFLRTPVADIADHERTSALRRDLEQLSSDAGAKLLRALGVKGHEEELRSASDEFSNSAAIVLVPAWSTPSPGGPKENCWPIAARPREPGKPGS